MHAHILLYIYIAILQDCYLVSLYAVSIPHSSTDTGKLYSIHTQQPRAMYIYTLLYIGRYAPQFSAVNNLYI